MLLSSTDGMSLEEGLAFEVYNGVGVGPDMQERIVWRLASAGTCTCVVFGDSKALGHARAYWRLHVF